MRLLRNRFKKRVIIKSVHLSWKVCSRRIEWSIQSHLIRIWRKAPNGINHQWQLNLWRIIKGCWWIKSRLIKIRWKSRKV
jgi:hypothetical protein